VGGARLGIAVAAALLTLACGGLAFAQTDGPDIPEVGIKPPSGPANEVLEAIRWDPRVIPVCWDAQPALEGHLETALASKERQWAQDQVARTWQRQGAAGIKFEGWGKCLGDSTGVRVQLDREVFLSVADVGKRLDGVYGGVYLGFGRSNPWMKLCASVESDYEKCFRWQVTHAFGHVLGLSDGALPPRSQQYRAELCEPAFAREHVRSSAVVTELPPKVLPPSAIRGDDPDGPAATEKTASWSNAMMSPCPTVRTMRRNSVSLTPRDIEDLQDIYCRPKEVCP
jgi:hypothetical protein